ncbi:MAG: hypothetical protein DRI73_10960 [Bacteroidetes bacterium]|nr:MAG: hypothetical protein DRI73_10960 [Bacteroidota bacterium]
MKDEIITFTIKDNGQGFPDTDTINSAKGFGLELVKILSQQIGSDISFSNDNGAKVIIVLNKTLSRKQ